MTEPETIDGLWFLLYQEAGTEAWRVHAEPFPSEERALGVGQRWKATLGDQTRVRIVRCLCIQSNEREIV